MRGEVTNALHAQKGNHFRAVQSNIGAKTAATIVIGRACDLNKSRLFSSNSTTAVAAQSIELLAMLATCFKTSELQHSAVQDTVIGFQLTSNIYGVIAPRYRSIQRICVCPEDQIVLRARQSR